MSARSDFAWVVVSARRRSSASSALRRAWRISFAVVAALRHSIVTLRPARSRQRLGEQFRLGQLAVDQDAPRRRHLLVELDQEAGQHLRLGHVGGVRREEAAVAPILAAADEEGLDRTSSRPCRRARRCRRRRAPRRGSPGCPGCRSARAAGRDRRRRARNPAPRPPRVIALPSFCCTLVDLPARKSLASSTSSA